MKKVILSLSCMMTIILANAQAPTLKWAKSLGGFFDDYGYSIAVDKSGNVYTTGWFFGTADFDPGAGTANLTSLGVDDIFISKLDASGNFLWAKQIGGTSYDEAQSIAIDATGNVLITGTFQGTADFDPGAGTLSLTSVNLGSTDAFVLKLNAAGDLVWAKGMGGTSTDISYSIAVDASNNVYTTGYFYNTVDFDPGAAINNLTAIGANDIFISKLDALGNFVWAKQLGGPSADQAFAIAVDPAGNVYTTGYFIGTSDFDPSSIATSNLTSNGVQDIFISKLDATGNFAWAKNMGGTLGDYGSSIAFDALGNVYATGYFQGTADFDPDAGISDLISAGNYDIFILKLNSFGTLAWAKVIGQTLNDQGRSIAVDAGGNVYTTGYFRTTADFDPGPGTYNLNAIGDLDVFISKLNTAGNFVWAVNVGGPASDQAHCLKLDVSGNLYTTGSFGGTVDFDPGTGVSNLTGIGGDEIYVLKLNTFNVGMDKIASLNNISIYPNPVHDVFHVIVPNPTNNLRIEIYNSLGALVYKQTNVDEINAIELTNQANGLYFVNVLDDENKTATGRIVKTE